MGYLTPVLFSNDAYDQFEKHPKETVANILTAMNDTRNGESYGVGNHCNPMTALPARHMSETSLFVCYGSTWVDLSKETSKELFSDGRSSMSTESLEQMQNFLKMEAKYLARVIKARKAEDK